VLSPERRARQGEGDYSALAEAITGYIDATGIDSGALFRLPCATLFSLLTEARAKRASQIGTRLVLQTRVTVL